MGAEVLTDLGLGPGEEAALTAGAFLVEVTRRHEDRAALVFAGRRTSYRELHQQARALARGLIAAGVGKGTKVALLMPNRPEWVAAAFAVGMSGGVLVPVNTYAPEVEREYVLRHSDAQLLLLQPRLLKHEYLHDLLHAHPELGAGRFGELAEAGLPYLRGIVSLDEVEGAGTRSWKQLLEAGSSVPDSLLDAAIAEVHSADDAMIIYTSGTTDRPKGVLHSHRAPCIQYWRWARQLRLTPEDRVWSTFPLFWTAGLSMVLGGTLAAGASLALQESFEASAALELLERERITTVHAWAHTQAELVEHPDAKRRDLSSLRRVARDSPLRSLPTVHVEDWDPGAAYGLSETFTICAALPADSPSDLRSTTHGRTLPGMDIRIIDEHGAPLRTGQLGEIAVKGSTLMRGYYKVSPERCVDADGFFHTRDAGYFDESGYLHWAGRLSGLIKTAGANVAPVEVESALMSWGRVKSASVVGVAHPTLGEAVVACVVRRADDPLTEDEVRAHLRGVLASYKVPRCVLFLAEEELVHTGNQKIKMSDLRDLVARRLAAENADPVWQHHLLDREKRETA